MNFWTYPNEQIHTFNAVSFNFRADPWFKTTWQNRVPQQQVVYKFGKRLCEKRGEGGKAAQAPTGLSGADDAVYHANGQDDYTAGGRNQSAETSQPHP